MFSMTDVTVCYDNVEAVRNVSLSVEEGQIVTVIGPNGAGKTTLLMAAIGLLASRGRLVFQGNDIGRMSGTIASLRDLGVSILLVEQNARAALETADYGYVLETGEVVQSGPAKDLIHDPRLITAYLGGH
nr:ATP-binding cassette domain-containing protein [Bradyrhizobium diazoefficiens]